MKSFKGTSIQRKIMLAIMLTSLTVVVLMSIVFATYDLVTYRQDLIRNLTTLSHMTADNSTPSLAFDIQSDAQDVLSALKADPHIVAAALYTRNGKLFAKYPEPTTDVPAEPEPDGLHVGTSSIKLFSPVVQNQNRLGTLYLNSDLKAFYGKFRLYTAVALLVILGSLGIAYVLSNAMQKRIALPILSLADSAKRVSENNDYSVRVPKQSDDELGLLTDAFNQMLVRIEEQTDALQQNEERLRLSLQAATVGTWDWDVLLNKVSWDEQNYRLFGRRPETFELTYKSFLDTLHPQDRAVVSTAMTQALEQKKEFFVEFRVVWPDGSIHPMLARGKAFHDARGKPVRLIGVTLDVTEQKRADETRAFLAAIVESSDDAIISKSLTGKIVTWNKGAKRLYGYTAEEAIGQQMTLIAPPDRVEEETKFLERIRLGESIEHHETVRVRKDGTRVDVSVTISPIRDNQGKIVGASKIAHDITERNRAQRELRRSEAQLRLIWENALDGMRLVDADGIIRMVNEAYCRLVEKSRDALEGQPLSVLYEAPRQDEVVSQHRKRFQERNVPPHFEREVTLWNGKKVFLELSNSFLEIEGQPILLVSTFRDITERKRAEQREAAFARLAQSLSVIASPTAAARVIAEVADELIGWDACSLDLYLPDEDLIYPVINIDTVDGKRMDAPPAYAGQAPSPILRRILERGGELILRREPYEFSPDATPFGNTSRPSASLIYVPIRLGQKTIGVLSVQSYTSQAYNRQHLNTLQTLADQCAGALERVRAQEELRLLNEELEERVRERTAELQSTNKDLEAFTYSVAHDLRAPLRHMDAYAKILREDFAAHLPPEAHHHLERIRRGSRDMSALVTDLLNLARVGRQELNREPMSLNSLAVAARTELGREMENRQIEWRIGSLPDAECDPGLMKQVFVNLLSNAIKYTRPRPTAVIEVGQTTVDGKTAIFVRDNGVGFNIKYANKLFGVFQRLHRADEFEGTGVGLAIVERIIRKHGGRVWAESELDRGATFYFTIARLFASATGSPVRAMQNPSAEQKVEVS